LLRLLDCGEAPRTRADRAHERPELLELHGFRAAAVDELPGLVGGVVEHVRREDYGSAAACVSAEERERRYPPGDPPDAAHLGLG
jgi:hypothetical protein